MKKLKISTFVLLLLCAGATFIYYKTGINPAIKVGQEIDNFNGVAVFFNGGVGNVEGRNLTADGYNLGLKYQCVEFVKRYYFEHLDHRMPNTYGHAKDFFDHRLHHGQKNIDRNLIQYSNGSGSKPKVNDLLIFSETRFNPYGHVAIISAVTDDDIEIVQQNPGMLSDSRERFELENGNGKWKIKKESVLGWLRKE